MTREHIEYLINYKKKLKEFHREWVLNTIKYLRKCQTKDIKKRMDELAWKHVEEEFEKGNIKENEKDALFKEHTMSRETIQRKLKGLVEDRVIVKHDHTYTLSFGKNAIPVPKYFNPDSAKEFSVELLDYLLELHDPKNDDFKKDVENTVTIFGFYILFLLMEACKPVSINNKIKAKEYRAKRFVTHEWFEKAVNPIILLNSFILTMTKHYSDEQRREHEIFHDSYLRYKAHKRENPLYGEVSPHYEISQSIIDQIYQILKESYPDHYAKALFTKENFQGILKEESLDDRRIYEIPESDI